MKTRLYFAIGTYLLLLSSCIVDMQEKTTVIPLKGELVTITAYVDDTPMTKTGLVDKYGGGKSVVWKSGNSISLFFNSGNNGGNQFTTSTNGPKAEFMGTISAVSGDLTGVGGKAYFWGLYPYNASASCDGTVITTTLPSAQLAYQGDVADDLLVTVGRSENLAIHFKNTCSVFGFTLTQEGISKVVFSGNAGEPVAGEFKISFDENNAVVDSPTENAVERITITPAESSTFEPGVTYYFASLPGTFSNGYTLTFTNEDGSEATYSRETSCTFKASTFYTMAGKDDGAVFAGLFSVSDSKIVFFSKGSLIQSQEGDLSFANKQYYYIGNQNTVDGTTYFGSTPNKDRNYPTDMFSTTFVQTSSQYASLGDKWSVLTQTEWRYLLEDRENASQLVAHNVTVHEIAGVVILPDNWLRDGRDPIDSSSTLSDEEFNSIENYGAIFIPYAGRMDYGQLYYHSNFNMMYVGEVVRLLTYRPGFSIGGQIYFSPTEVSYSQDYSDNYYGLVRLVSVVSN